MTCMCGDTHCGSCGPAQGNSRCPICSSWADDGCEHFDEETGKLKTEFVPEAERIWDLERKGDEDYAQLVEDEERKERQS
jgi:hypothetical protein